MRRPPVEAPPAQAAETEPKTHPVKAEDFYGSGPSAAEDEDRPGIGIALELVSTEPGQPINAFAEVHGLDGHQYPHLWRDLYQ